MSRLLQTGLFPAFPGQIADGTAIVALHPRSANDGSGRSSVTLERLAGDAIRRNGLTPALGVTARHLLRTAIRRAVPEAHAASLASRISSILNIVLRTGVDPDKLIEHGSPRVRQLGLIAGEYKRLLRERNLIDREEMLLTAAGLGPERRPLVIYGYHRARKEEIFFIDAIAGDGSVLYLPCGSEGMFTVNRRWAHYLSERGWDAVEERNGPATTGENLAAAYAAVSAPPPVDARAYPDIDAEVRACLAEAKQMVVNGADAREIAIAVRGIDDYAPVIAAVAAEYGLPVNISLAVPVARTAIGSLIGLVLEAAEKRLGFEAAARLLMHPFGPKMPESKWTEARIERTSGVEKWSEVCPELASLDLSEEPRTLAERADNLVTFLRSVKVREKAAPRARELLAYRKFTESLDELTRLDGRQMMPPEAFAAAIGELLADESVPYSPAAAGIEVIEPKNIVGRSFERVFVLGMAEGAFPRPASEDPVIDFFERRLLAARGIEFAGAAEVARWEELSFYFTLLSARGDITFSFPKVSDDGDSVASSFFKRLGVERVPEARAMLVASSPEELRTRMLRTDVPLIDDAVIGPARARYRVERRREDTGDYDEYDGVIGVPYDAAARKWSASQLTQIGQCSFRWFAERILRLKPVDEMELALDPATRGTLYHKALEIAVARAMGAADIRAATLEYIDEAFAEAEAHPEVKLPNVPNWEAERADQIQDLKKAIRAADFIAPGSRVVGVEVGFDTVHVGLRFTGSIDRVDDSTDGLIAVDYKTSSSKPLGAKGRDGKLDVDVQIPLYANAALKALYPNGDYGDSAYYSLTKGKILRTEKEGDIDKLNELIDDVKTMLSDGAFAVDPDVSERVCKYCELGAVCRKGPRLRRKSRQR